jgi:hypothetical protein
MLSAAVGVLVPIPTLLAKYAFPVVVAPPFTVRPPVCVPLPIVVEPRRKYVALVVLNAKPWLSAKNAEALVVENALPVFCERK